MKKTQMRGRRAILTGLGAMVTAGAMGTRVEAQATATFTPVLHSLDDWMSALPGKHRVVFDVTSPAGLPDVIRFLGNYATGHKNGYEVDESDLARLVCFRHGATAYGYGDFMWSKYGKMFDAKATPPPTANPFNSGERMQLAEMAKRGVQFMVCGTASRNRAIALAGPGGDADAIFKEMLANLIPSARMVPAGVVAVTHAQERGFAVIHVG
jgi:hypothetical protein